MTKKRVHGIHIPMIHRLIRTLILSIALLPLSIDRASAQAATQIDFAHAPVTLSELPSPGKPVVLSVIMKKDVIGVGMKVRALIARDGKLIEIQDVEPDLDSQDRAIFRFEVPSPLAEMSYQFLFNDKLGQGSSSKRYVVQRACVPNVQVTNIQKSGNTVVTKDDVGTLITQAKGLERDIDLYERTIKLLNEIHVAVENR